jgi:chaperonin GroEL
VLEAVAQQGAPLLIVAEDIEGDALSALVINKLRGVLNVCAGEVAGLRRSPQGDARRSRESSPAACTSPKRPGKTLETITLADLGRAKKIVVKKDDTIVVDGEGKKKAIEERIEQVRAKIDVTTSDYDREKLQERLAELTGGVAVISVGAATEKELTEKKFRVEDAMHAARAAREEGIVAGGGTALLRCIPAVEDARRKAKGDEQLGVDIVLAAMRSPCAQIAENAGFDGDVTVESVLELPASKSTWGFDARAGEVVDMVKSGIVDPVKVTRLALEYAASVAGLMLMADTTITSVKDGVDPVAGLIS